MSYLGVHHEMLAPHAVIVKADGYVQAVQSMIAARENASKLLEFAERVVEIAIEDPVAAALAYLAGGPVNLNGLALSDFWGPPSGISLK